MTVIEVVPPGSCGTKSNDANPYGVCRSRYADHGAGSVVVIAGCWLCGLPGPTLVIRTPSCGMSEPATGVGVECPPPPMIMWTVPFEVSLSTGLLLRGAGVRRPLSGTVPRTGQLRPKRCSWPATTTPTPYLSNSGSHC